MKMITPIEINSSNMTSTIPEPDISMGEEEWSDDFDNGISLSNRGSTDLLRGHNFAVVSNGIIVLESSDGLFYAYDKDGNLTDSDSLSFSAASSAQGLTPSPIDPSIAYFVYDSSGTSFYIREVKILDNGSLYSLDQFYVETPAEVDTTGGTVMAFDGEFFYVLMSDETVDPAEKYLLKLKATPTITTFSDLFSLEDSKPDSLSIIGFTSMYYYDGLIYATHLISGDIWRLTTYGEFYDDEPYIKRSQTGLSSSGRATSSYDYVNDLIYFGQGISAGESLGLPNILFIHNDTFENGKWYKTGERVIKTSTHKLYEAASINGDDPEIGVNLTPPSWVEVSATNKYKAFDYTISTKASISGSSSTEYEFTLSAPCTNVAVFGMENVESVSVTVTQDSVEEYSSTKDTSFIDAPTEDLLVNDAFKKSKVIFDDLPITDSPVIKVTFTGTSKKIGDILLGNARTLGVALYESSTSRTSYDTVEVDTFGNETIVSRPSAEYTSFEISVPSQYNDYVEELLKGALNKPRVWVGDKADNEKIFTIGYYERSPLVYSSPTMSDTTLKIRGLV